ncbi:sugar efflux transporter for intercellular exchange-domain-containing protein [Entophlyctis helioformis]|nr:sugar efflux transporter for intercellular exchange-domain-containing protein [Entophlyctis helioformis]
MTPLELAATALTIGMFLSGLAPLRAFAEQRSTGNASITPSLSTFLNCALWLKYGVLLAQPAMVAVNAVGVATSVLALYVFCKYSDRRADAERLVLYALAFVAIVFAYIFTSYSPQVVEQLGFLTAMFSIVMFGSPLLSLAKVIQTRSAAGLISLQTALISLTACVLWTLFGQQINNSFVIVPNLIGGILCLLQLAVLAVYGSSSSPYDHVPVSTAASSSRID